MPSILSHLELECQGLVFVAGFSLFWGCQVAGPCLCPWNAGMSQALEHLYLHHCLVTTLSVMTASCKSSHILFELQGKKVQTNLYDSSVFISKLTCRKYKVCIKTNSTQASLPRIGQVTAHTTMGY